ncbi:MAG: 8-amino-7-oxononanoate synthase [Candidatus Tectomicrobia bacterium]|uniref:8-amino-7-oxononanoate synthase n=1 Tax=Tectimicrobiota bacterium TaxID=2528274 RepID=A0A932I4V5_UNCTE|nr:8-amino-7-oxononanoate synthase [Candidatus Tectomicrobia bacterium]
MSETGSLPFPPEPGWRASLREELEALSARGHRRSLRAVDGRQGPVVRHEGREVILLASNNYLGLADHPALVQAAADAARRWGASAAASPLISGHMEPHAALAAALAALKEKEAALLFGSGFLANLGLLSALAGPGDAVFSDALNHASIIDGCRLSRAGTRVFPHNDMDALERALREARGARRKIIAVDGVFSMDGDLAPLPALAELAKAHGALLIVDEAHATGVLGPEGRGAAAHFGLQRRVGVAMGTLGKALASYGAFAAADGETVDYLVNRARPYIYSTALPPPAVAAARAALQLSLGEEGARRRARLKALCARFRAGLRRIGFAAPDPSEGVEVPIFPVVVGEARKAVELAEHMLRAGVFLLAIRPPTVPEGTSRLRATLMATHTERQIDQALDALEEGVKKLQVAPTGL